MWPSSKQSATAGTPQPAAFFCVRRPASWPVLRCAVRKRHGFSGAAPEDLVGNRYQIAQVTELTIPELSKQSWKRIGDGKTHSIEVCWKWRSSFQWVKHSQACPTWSDHKVSNECEHLRKKRLKSCYGTMRCYGSQEQQQVRTHINSL